MGYCISLHDSRFKIKRSNVKLLAKLLDDTIDSETSESYIAEVVRGYAEENRWPFSFDKNGNVDDISFDGEKLYDDKEFFSDIAKFVETGSYIEILGEEGDRWRWVFKDKKVYEYKAIITWEPE